MVQVTKRVQKTQKEGKLTGMLLMHVKSAFDYVIKNGKMPKMEAVGADGDLVRWTGFFISERKVSLVVDGHHCETVEVGT